MKDDQAAPQTTDLWHFATMDGWPGWAVALRNVAILSVCAVVIYLMWRTANAQR